jgi:hypothetical protein
MAVLSVINFFLFPFSATFQDYAVILITFIHHYLTVSILTIEADISDLDHLPLVIVHSSDSLPAPTTSTTPLWSILISVPYLA